MHLARRRAHPAVAILHMTFDALQSAEDILQGT